MYVLAIKVFQRWAHQCHESGLDMQRSSSAFKTIFSLTAWSFRKTNSRLGLFDKTAGDQKSRLLPEEVFLYFSGIVKLLKSVPEGNILLKLS